MLQREVIVTSETPVNVLRYYAGSRDAKVRRKIAELPSVPLDVLTGLCNDKALEVALAAVRNPNVCFDVIFPVWKSIAHSAARSFLLNTKHKLSGEQYAGLYSLNSIPFKLQRAYNVNPEKLSLGYILGLSETESLRLPLSLLTGLYYPESAHL